VFIYRVTQNQRSHPLGGLVIGKHIELGDQTLHQYPRCCLNSDFFLTRALFQVCPPPMHVLIEWYSFNGSLVSCLLLHVDAGACFIWRIDVQLLSINMASAANDLCISVVLWFQRLPLFVVTICNNNFVLHLPEVAAFCTLTKQLQSVYSFILCHAP